MDVETLGYISRVLSANEIALDLVSLHVELPALVSCALAFVEEYDCEAVGTSENVLKCSCSHHSQVIPKALSVILAMLSYSHSWH
jgi:mediator of RNA polymerase II transcription subunit 5